MLCGIYAIINKINGKMYIGQSINIDKRWKEHKSTLNNNTHENEHLQKSFNKYGINNFDYMILECCLDDELNSKEKYWIGYYKTFESEYGYNKTFGGDKFKITPESANKIRQHHLGTKHSQETKSKISKAHMGKVVSQETRDKLSKRNIEVYNGDRNPNALITESTAKEIIELLLNNFTPKEVSEILKVSKIIVDKIKQKKSWGYLTKQIVFPLSRKGPLKGGDKDKKIAI